MRAMATPVGTRARQPPATPRSLFERLAGAVVRIDPRETDFDVRGFAPCADSVRSELELHGRSFVAGFNAATATAGGPSLVARLEEVESARRGFAYEGAAMGLALLDLLLPWPRGRRFDAFVRLHAERHVYMAHVGAGWALARLGRRPWAGLTLDPLLRWLALDGYGFHESFFHPDCVVRARRRPRRLRGYELRVFDQGVGRALWFVEAADPDRIATTVGTFERKRRSDLWSGVGLAATYAGAAADDALTRLAEVSRPYRAQLAQGAAFAAKARICAGNVVPHVERATAALAGGVTASIASAATDHALAGIEGGRAEDYERWRAAIARELAGR
jgi:hypothetical protein